MTVFGGLGDGDWEFQDCVCIGVHVYMCVSMQGRDRVRSIRSCTVVMFHVLYFETHACIVTDGFSTLETHLLLLLFQ